MVKAGDGTFHIAGSNRTVKSITLEGGAPILIGRKAGGDLSFKVTGSAFALRDAVNGAVPIGSYAEFQLIGTALDGTYRQEADLDLMNEEWMPVGSSSNQFTGVFDGGGHTLERLAINQPAKDYIGLFGCVGSGGTLSNIAIVSGSVSGKERVGSVCGVNYGSITSCCNAGAVSGTGNGVGGVCGDNYSGHITSCYNTGAVSGGNTVGGVCGSTYYDGIRSCYNTGAVLGNQQIGGVCGLKNGYIGSCYWDDVSGDNATYGIGAPASNSGAEIFSANTWPTAAANAEWGIGDGSGNGKYWKSLGGWNNGNPVYPKLWFEE